MKGNPVFSNGPKSLHKNIPDCPILSNWVFDNFLLAEEPFAKVFRSFETCVLVNNNLCGKPNHYNYQKHLMKVLKLLQYHILFQIVSYQVVN